MSRLPLKMFVVALVVLGFGLLVANQGSAHPRLLNFGADSVPTPGSLVRLSEMPDQIELVFNEEIDAERSYMVLERNQGAVYADMGDPTVDLDAPERNIIRVTVDPNMIEPGTYTVHYIVFSPPDSGITVGSYNFAVVED